MSSTIEGTALHWVDVVVIIAYFGFILFIGLWTSRTNRGSVGGYFLAGKSMHWLPVGASLFASNVGSLHFVGLSGSGAASGIAIALFEFNAIFVLLLLGWLFLPVYIASGVFTMPEYVRKRFGGQRIRIYIAVLSLLLYIFTKISADLFAGALFIEQALGWNLYASIIVLLAIAALFTITGGLTAVIWTDFVQTFIMVFGAIALLFIGLIEVGGWEAMEWKYARSMANTTLYGNDTCGYPRDDFMHLIRDPLTGDIPWPGIFGMTVTSIWYWCTDQVIVQRTLSGRSFSHAKGGTILAGWIKLLPMFMLVIPGMLARILFPDEIACSDPDLCEEICGSPGGCTNIAYSTLVLELLPAGARGLMLAVMLAALMSSLTSIFNSAGTIFTIDIWKKFRKNANDTEQLVVARICVLVLVVISILWIPVIQASQGSQLFVYIQQVSSFLTPPICAIYLTAILWPGLNEPGAFWSLMLGLVVGSTRFIMEMVFPPPVCGEEDDRPWTLIYVHYLYFAVFLFLLTICVAVGISLCTDPIDEKHLYRLTFWTRWSTEPRENIDNDSVVSLDASIDEKADLGDETDDEEEEKVPWWKAAYQWLCGMEKPVDAPQLTDEEMAALAAKQMSIEEDPWERKFCNINAVIIMVITMFVVGFFA